MELFDFYAEGDWELYDGCLDVRPFVPQGVLGGAVKCFAGVIISWNVGNLYRIKRYSFVKF